MRHIRIYGRVFPFWRPCIFSQDLTEEELLTLVTVLDKVQKLTHNAITFEVTA